MNTKENINKFTEMASKNKSNFISYAETRLKNKTREENSFDEDCLIIDRLEELNMKQNTNNMIPIGQDNEGNDLFPGDIVIRDGDIEETIEYGKYRDKFDCGYIVGYYIPDYCVKKDKNK